MLSVGIDIGGSSIKAAALRVQEVIWQRQSRPYHKPALATLKAALREVIPAFIDGPLTVGLCLPGLFDRARRRITLAVNAPGLQEADLDALLADVIGPAYRPALIVNDAIACGTDVVTTHNLHGRSLILALGTGVGAAVLDDGTPVFVEGATPGHLGQIDVSIDTHPVIAPDGGRGGLEGYIGAASLHQLYGPDLARAFAAMRGDEPCLLALSRAIRICHAIYRPDQVFLCGGIGTRLRPLIPTLDRLIRTHLTSVAKPSWTLASADHDFHAAVGSARLALRQTDFA